MVLFIKLKDYSMIKIVGQQPAAPIISSLRHICACEMVGKCYLLPDFNYRFAQYNRAKSTL